MATDYALDPAVRRRIAERNAENLVRRDTRGPGPSVGERCRSCRQRFPLGVLEHGICHACEFDEADRIARERRMYEQRLPLGGVRIA